MKEARNVYLVKEPEMRPEEINLHINGMASYRLTAHPDGSFDVRPLGFNEPIFTFNQAAAFCGKFSDGVTLSARDRVTR